MLVDFACLPILSQQSAKNPLSSHPDDTGWHSGFSCSFTFSGARMSSLSLCSMGFTNPEAGMHNGGFFHNETISVEFADVLTRIGIADFGGFVGIEPDLALAAAQNFGGQGLLRAEVGHVGGYSLVGEVW